MDLKIYDSMIALTELYNDILNSLPPDSISAVLNSLEKNEVNIQIGNRIAALPHPIQIDQLPNDILVITTAGTARAILRMIPEIASDPDKNDVLTLFSELMECLYLIETKRASLTPKMTPLEFARADFVNERFREKPFIHKNTSIDYEYYQDTVPEFMEEKFHELVTEKLMGALNKNPNTDLSPYEKELGITIKSIKHPTRTNKTSAVPTTKLKDVIL